MAKCVIDVTVINIIVVFLTVFNILMHRKVLINNKFKISIHGYERQLRLIKPYNFDFKAIYRQQQAAKAKEQQLKIIANFRREIFLFCSISFFGLNIYLLEVKRKLVTSNEH